MLKFAQTCERIAGTPKKLEKVAIVGEYIKSCPIDQAVVAAVFLSGRPFPVWEETTLNVGGTLLWRVVEALSGKAERDLSEAYRRHGDLGAVAAEVLPAINGRDLSVAEIQARFRQIAAARGPVDKSALVRELLSQVTPLEAKYILKIMTGDLRIGLKESLVEEAIAKAYGGTLPQVQRANMLLGDIGQTLELAAAGKLAEAKMRLFHPLGFMLASPAESAEEALSYFENAFVEDKYDGIRAQVLDALLAAARNPVAERSGSAQARLIFDSAEPAQNTRVLRAPVFQASSAPELDSLFDAAQSRGNEGLMIKDPESPYTPGRRGKSWLKLKRELATLDVVVTAVEFGHGKRIGVLSDYTFAVRDGDRLLNIGKAYSGLTDAEILEMTKWFLE